MSFLFRDMQPYLSKIVLEPVDSPPAKASGIQGPTEGMIWNDVTQNTIGFRHSNLNIYNTGALQADNSGSANLTGISNSTSETVIWAGPTFLNAASIFEANNGLLQVVNKTLRLTASGIWTTPGSQTPTIQWQIRFGGLTGTSVFSATTGAVTASQTSVPWTLQVLMVINTATANATTIDARGFVGTPLTAPTAAMSFYGDTVGAGPSSAIDFTTSQQLVLTAKFSTAASGSLITPKLAVLEVTN